MTPGGRVAIVGAGPAGLFAAERLAAHGFAVTIYERMPSPARKFLMAGRGGLNLTHSEALEHILSRYQDPGGVVRRAVTAFPPADLIRWADALGAQTFTGSSGRIFPKAMKASPLLRAWLRRLGDLGVVLRTNWTWRGFGEAATHLVFDTAAGVQTVAADAVLLALGGASWPRLGSDGSWVPILQGANVSIAPLQASNCGVTLAWSPHMAKHDGEPLKRIAVTCGSTTRRGEAVLTKRGLEGGVIYALCPQFRDALKSGDARITIDLRPDLDADALTNRLARAPGKDSLANTLRKAASLSPCASALLRESGALPRTPADLARCIKAVELSVTGLCELERAISTAGGVTAQALNAHLMLRARPGVFVAGEMLDFDAPTGGYLLQAAFATGSLAALGIKQWFTASVLPPHPSTGAETQV